MSVDWNSRNEKIEGARRTTIVMVVIIVTVALLGGVVYAILTSISVTNNVTITPGVGLGVATFSAVQTSCPALGNTAYGTVTPFTNTVAWAIAAGGSTTEYFCIENQGSGVDQSPSITLTNIPATISCTTAPCLTLATSPVTIPTLNAQSISLPIAVTITATASASGSGTVAVTVS